MSFPRPELWHRDDDWSGTTSPAERRQRQNRLNQRARRKKKLYQRLPPPNDAETRVAGVDEDLPLLVAVKRPEERQHVVKFLQVALENWKGGIPAPRDLPMLTRLNALNGLVRNAQALGIPSNLLQRNDFKSPFNFQEPTSSASDPMPMHLRPTTLQKAVTHHIWVDLFPIPRVRDNILRCIQAGEFEQGRLCEELICRDMITLDGTSSASLSIWGEPWDAGSWEFSAGFFSTWGFLLHGCPEVLATTNYWREMRGEMRIDFVLHQE